MIRLSQIVAFFILAPLYFQVFSYCPFRLPYLYCFICPLRYLWSGIRGFVLLVALGLNIRKDLFCAHLCPFGTVQVFLSKISPKKISLPKFFYNFKYVSVILIVLVIAITKVAQLPNHRFTALSLSQVFIAKGKGVLFGAFVLSMAASIFNYRCFFNILCPITASNRILQKVISSFKALTGKGR